jgi:hypothetical protein
MGAGAAESASRFGSKTIDHRGTRLLGLERRQVFRLLKAYRTEGPAGLISKRRNRQHRLQPGIKKPRWPISGPARNT